MDNFAVKLQLTPFKYPDLTEPLGRLPNDKRAQACWYFYTIAEKSRQMIGHGDLGQGTAQFGLLDDHLWMDKRYVDQARAVATLYGLDSPDEFAKFWPYVQSQAADMGYPEPAPEYTRLEPRRIIM